MPSALESIRLFLTARRDRHNSDLLDRFLQHAEDMEVQVNVSAGDGLPVEGKRSTYTDGVNNWFNFRVPKQADSEPFFDDFSMAYPLDLHAEGIGSTGWDWRNRVSRWVGFDFDDISGHAAGIGISDSDLHKVREAAKALPYVEARVSTGGRGLHLYVLLDEIPTENHTVHAGLARAVLGLMSRDAGFDFQASIDACGSVLWIWHRKATEANSGLSLIKPSERIVTLKDLPANWRDYVEVTSGRRSKVRLPQVEDEDTFDRLTAAYRREPLDDTHRAVIDKLVELGYPAVWASDHWLLQTHTLGLAAAKDHLGLQGVYATNSPGTDISTPNCFCYPIKNGGWKVVRFSQGVREHNTWTQDGKGWTYTYFNVQANLETVARFFEAAELTKGGYQFPSLAAAIESLKLLEPNLHVPAPADFLSRPAIVISQPIRGSGDDEIIIQVRQEKIDKGIEVRGWNDVDRPKFWTHKVQALVVPRIEEDIDYDNIIRSATVSVNQPVSWYVKTSQNFWGLYNRSDVQSALSFHGFAKAEIDKIMGWAVINPWRLVCRPFEEEYPGDRQWNFDAPQLRCHPASRDDMTQDSKHPHFDLILQHCGQYLTPYLDQLEWARNSNIRTGADYLAAYMACILRFPFEATPYLAIVGAQNTGKSMFATAFHMLITKGFVAADNALTTQQEFNGELEGAIFCYVDEIDCSGGRAKDRLKYYVTSDYIKIRKMRTDLYVVKNSTHWCQTTNDTSYVPVFPGDTRVTMTEVPRITEEIPELVLKKHLEEEAPFFLRTLLDMELPPVQGRLRIPVVDTDIKRETQDANKSPVIQFVEENIHKVPGEAIKFKDFFQRFVESISGRNLDVWSNRRRVKSHLPEWMDVGRWTGGELYLGNVAWEPCEPTKPVLIKRDDNLYRETANDE